MLSRPAFVLESDAKIMPSSSLTPTQYVTLAASRSVALADDTVPETRMPQMIPVRTRQSNRIGAGGEKKSRPSRTDEASTPLTGRRQLRQVGAPEGCSWAARL